MAMEVGASKWPARAAGIFTSSLRTSQASLSVFGRRGIAGASRRYRFDFATKDGKKYAVTKRDEEFTRNFSSTFLVPPGEHQVFAVHLDEPWVTHPPFPKADEMPITVKAIYEVPPTPEASQHKVWTGRVEPHTYDLTLRQW
jgi:hypothetical protein